MKQAFIVGTGRCGSTTISDLLNLHSNALSLSEFFAHITDLGGDVARAFPSHPISGDAFWDLLSSPLPGIQSTIAQCGSLPEWLHPVGAPCPAPRGAGVPPVLLTTLPHLTEDYEALFLELQHRFQGLPERPAPHHYRNLFTLLARRFGKEGWIERSGGSLYLTRELSGSFPDARFLHLVRDGHQAAWSMARHPGFRHRTGLPPLAGTDPTQNDLRLFGRLWSSQIITAIQGLQHLPPNRLFTIRFEQFLDEPEPAIRAIERFLAIRCNPEAIEHFGDRKIPEPELSRQALEILNEACEPGYLALEGQASLS